jgi:hypothetical protein
MPGGEPRAMLWVRRACIALFAVHMVFSVWDFYRRIRQILRVDLAVSTSTLRPGVIVSTDVIATGETRNQIRLELRQGDHLRVLYEERARVSTVSMYDPRVFQYQRRILIADTSLSVFVAGPATLRLTGFGGLKLLRTPAPRVRELAVIIAPRSGNRRQPF